MSPKIVVVGSYNTDLISYMSHLPEIGETVMGSRFASLPGGKGSNQAVAAARLGAEVTFVARVGADIFAETGYGLWESEGINVGYITRDAHQTTGVANIYVNQDGANMIVVTPGANAALSPADVDAAAAVIRAADALLVQLEIPLVTVAHALKLAREAGVRTVLNPAPATALARAVLPLCDVVTPNRGEATILSSVSAGPGRAALIQEAAALRVMGCAAAVLTLGADGAVWSRAEDSGKQDAFAVEVLDTVGAGDAFSGALTVALAEGQEMAAAVRFANAVAALACTAHGAASSMPQRGAVAALLAQQQQP